MKRPIMMGLLISMTACAGLPSRAEETAARAERWQGFMLRNGLGVPIELTLAQADRSWSGQLRVANSSVLLEHVRLTALGVSRISYGPIPYIRAMSVLQQEAKTMLS